MGRERRGRVVRVRLVVNQSSWKEPGERSRSQVKPFDIPKQMVWEAYQRVKANKGAAGVDGQSVEQFEQDLRNNLYRLWNRMSSGSYFPPPVKAVEIPRHREGSEFSEYLP